MDIKKSIKEFEEYLYDLGCSIENQNEPDRSITKNKIISIRNVLRILSDMEKGDKK